jgi:hypothetical protein
MVANSERGGRFAPRNIIVKAFHLFFMVLGLTAPVFTKYYMTIRYLYLWIKSPTFEKELKTQYNELT